MSLRKHGLLVVPALVSALNCASAAETQINEALADKPLKFDAYSIGGSYSDDQSYAVNLGADWSLGELRHLRLGGGYAHANEQVGLSTSQSSKQTSLEFDTRFNSLGTAIGAEYWGDGEAITTYRGRLRLYWQGEEWLTGLRYERTRSRVQYNLPPALQPYIDDTRIVQGNTYGLNIRWSSNPIDVYADARYYDYGDSIDLLFTRADLSRVPPPRLQQLLDRFAELRRSLANINTTSLRLSDNLLDYAIILGADYRIGEHSLNLELTRDRAALDDVILESVTLGWVIPIADHADIELRFGVSHIDTLGSSIVGGINLSLYRMR